MIFSLRIRFPQALLSVLQSLRLFLLLDLSAQFPIHQAHVAFSLFFQPRLQNPCYVLEQPAHTYAPELCFDRVFLPVSYPRPGYTYIRRQ